MSKFIPYLRAKKQLEDRLGATADEIATWVYMEPVPTAESCRNKNFRPNNQAHLKPFRYWPCLPLEGLAAHTDVKEFDDPPRFHFDWEDHGNNYLGPLHSCWFRAEDIAAFRPLSRYITGQALMERWQAWLGDQVEGFIAARIDESDLIDFYPTGVETQWSSENSDVPEKERDFPAPPKDSALFVLAHIETIEAEHGIVPVRTGEAPPAPEQTKTDAQEGSAGTWMDQARKIADECYDSDAATGTIDVLSKKDKRGEVDGGYAYRVMVIMQERKIHGPRGRIDNAATIAKEALQGKKWWSNKVK